MRRPSHFAILVLMALTAGCPDDGPAGASADPDASGTPSDTAGDPNDVAADAPVAPDTADTADASGPADTGSDAIDAADTADAASDPCGPGGFCRVLAASSCGEGAFRADPGTTCTTTGGGDGYCCRPMGCTSDADCPGCELCEKSGAGPGTCVDPTETVGPLCSAVDPCPDGQCCSFAALTKPGCGGLCVPDDGTADCTPCMGEGGPTNVGSVVGCCAGLEAIPTMMTLPGGVCETARCLDCLVCVKDCGDGACTTGEDACNCPADCATDAGVPGSACTTNEDCDANGACLPEASGYPTGGYCTGGVCDPSATPNGCPEGTVCKATLFAAAYLCLPTCGADADCRPGLTCEALPEGAPTNGGTICWESGKGKTNPILGFGLAETCDTDGDCISNLCLVHPASGDKVCAAFCNDDTLCKTGQSCNPMGGCGSPGCGACFTP